MTGLSSCRTCHEPIRFVKTRAGKPMPVNPKPNPENGNVAARLTSRGDLVDAEVIKQAADRRRYMINGYQIFLAHFATCPERGRTAKPDPTPAPTTPQPEQPRLF